MIDRSRVALAAMSLVGSVPLLTRSYVSSEVGRWHGRLVEPPKTSIVVPALDEEEYIEETLLSLENQNVRYAFPEKFEVVVVDGGSIDRTVEISRNFDTKIVSGPKGKLNGRHVGILKAENDVIVGVDADTYYPPNWLNLVLRHFRDPEVVGVTSPRLYSRDSNIILDYVMNWSILLDKLTGRMAGCNSAFRKQAYFDIGGFNRNVNQFDVEEMVREEEFAFPRRLRSIGRITWEWKAPSFSSARRFTRGHKSTFRKDDNPLLYPE